MVTANPLGSAGNDHGEVVGDEHPAKDVDFNGCGADVDTMDEDAYLEVIGGWGRYQCLNTIVSWAAAAVVSCHVMVMYYVHLSLELDCDGPNCSPEPTLSQFCTGVNTANYTNPLYPGWALVGPESLQWSWNLECVDRWLVPLSDSGFFLGWLLGGVCCGKLGDIYGRRKPLAAYFLLTSATLGLTTLAPSMGVFIPLKFLHGFTVGPLLLTNYVYGSEFVPQRRFALFGTMYFMIGAAGCACLAILAWKVQNWRHFCYIVCLFTAPLAAWPLLSPESPMWLLSVGKLDRALGVFKKIAFVNGKQVPLANPRSAFRAVDGEADDDAEAPPSGSLLLLTMPKLRKVTISMMVVWLSCSLCYFGLGLSGATLPGNAYFNAALLSMVELPVYPMQLLAVDSFLGRKKTMMFSLLIGAACCLLTLLPIGDASKWFAFGGNMFMTAAFTTTYIWAAEVFPAEVRAGGLGFCTGGGKIGSTITPFIVDFAADNLELAMAVSGRYENLEDPVSLESSKLLRSMVTSKTPGAYATDGAWDRNTAPAARNALSVSGVRAGGLGFCTGGGKVGSTITPFIVDF
eukprot:gene10402-16027_t